MLFCLMLSHLSFRLSSLKKIFFSFCCSLWVISTSLSSRLLIHSSFSLNLLLIPSTVFFPFSYCILQLCNFCMYFLLFSISLLKFSLCSSSLVSIFKIIILNSLSGRLVTSVSLRSFFLRFHLVLLFETHSCVSSFCLTLCLFLCIRQTA